MICTTLACFLFAVPEQTGAGPEPESEPPAATDLSLEDQAKLTAELIEQRRMREIERQEKMEELKEALKQLTMSAFIIGAQYYFF